jgi:DNA-binding NarL/FixJ family response regulator
VHAAAARERIGILIVDDQRPFAEGLMTVLGEDDRLEVCGHARDGEEAIRLVSLLRPDLVLMDVAMPRMDGIEATRRIKNEAPDLPVIMLTSSPSDDDIERAARVGAAGYLTKRTAMTDLISTAVELAALAKAFSVSPVTPAHTS